MGDSGCSAGDKHMDTRGQWGDSGCSPGDTHMDSRGQWGTEAAVLAIHIWIRVVSGVKVAAVLRYTCGYTWPMGDSGCSAGYTLMDTRGQWVTVAVVLAIHL